MPVPTRDLTGMRRSHAALLADLAWLTDDAARAPSRLPGWSVGHLVTHLARNADSVTRRLAGAARGDVLDQYVERPAWRLPFGRWREVEVHRVDLGLGHTPADWPPELVAAWLPEVLAGLPGRADPSALLAWALGRGDPPALADWG